MHVGSDDSSDHVGDTDICCILGYPYTQGLIVQLYCIKSNCTVPDHGDDAFAVPNLLSKYPLSSFWVCVKDLPWEACSTLQQE